MASAELPVSPFEWDETREGWDVDDVRAGAYRRVTVAADQLDRG